MKCSRYQINGRSYNKTSKEQHVAVIERENNRTFIEWNVYLTSVHLTEVLLQLISHDANALW